MSDEDDARRGMPVSDVDRYLGDYKVLRIKAGWPFAAQRTSRPELPAPALRGRAPRAGALQRADRRGPRRRTPLRRHYQAAGDPRDYAHVTLILADAFPFAGSLQFDTAAALIELGRPREAVRYSRRAVGLEPRNVNHWLVHAHGAAAHRPPRRGRGRRSPRCSRSSRPTPPPARCSQELAQELTRCAS